MRLNIRFDNSGRSLGIADVYFSKRSDAQDAIDALNNRTLDGTRPLHARFCSHKPCTDP